MTLVLDCGAAESVDNSSLTTQSGTTFGAMAMYVCNVGYHIDSGDTERYCEGSGFWNGTLLTCLIDGRCLPDFFVLSLMIRMVCGVLNNTT